MRQTVIDMIRNSKKFLAAMDNIDDGETPLDLDSMSDVDLIDCYVFYVVMP